MAPVSFTLLGPPETHDMAQNHQPQLENHQPQSNAEPRISNPFIDLMVANFNTPPPVRGLTENLSATYLSSGNPCLDFFFYIVPDTPADSLTQRLSQAWKHDPLTSLKLICHLRGVRKTGKSDKEGFYAAALWLHEHHPKTLAANVKHMVDFGYFKDLPEILYRLLEGLEVRKNLKRARPRKAYVGSLKRGRRSYVKQPCLKQTSRKRRKNYNERKDNTWFSHAMKRSIKLSEGAKEKSEELQKRKIEAERMMMRAMKVKAGIEREEKKIDMARRAIERYNSDANYRLLHDRVADVFAERLVADLKFLKSGEVGKIGLASKWCPSLNSSFDRVTLLCESIAKRVFTRELYPEYEGVEEAHYSYRVRDRLRKEYLVPLRQALELPELYMSSNEWNSLPYARVASVAMKNYKTHFLRHDKERFEEYLAKVKRGEAKIAAGALLPHEVIKELEAGDGGEVAELQWKRMVDDLLQSGKLRNCIAVCDVSGSMNGTPMDVCVALGLLISELSEDPWKGQVITFSQNPQLHLIKGDNLKEKIKFVKKMEWGANTDFQKVFDRLLEVAVNGKLNKDQMIKKIFVFSDMEFDCASDRNGFGGGDGFGHYLNKQRRNWDSDYEVIQKKFARRGYEVPEIVFWNLRDSSSIPVTKDQKGVALVSGFSKNMVTLFLEEDEDMLAGTTPEDAMNLAISSPEFSQLRVLD